MLPYSRLIGLKSTPSALCFTGYLKQNRESYNYFRSEKNYLPVISILESMLITTKATDDKAINKEHHLGEKPQLHQKPERIAAAIRKDFKISAVLLKSY